MIKTLHLWLQIFLHSFSIFTDSQVIEQLTNDYVWGKSKSLNLLLMENVNKSFVHGKEAKVRQDRINLIKKKQKG